MVNNAPSDTQRLQQLNRMYLTISRCNHHLIRAEDEQTLAQNFCSVMVEEGGYRMAWVGYAENDEALSIRPIAYAGFESGYLENLNLTWADTDRGSGPGARCIREQTVQVTRDIANDPRFVHWREEAANRGYASSIALPLKIGTGTRGFLGMYSERGDAFDEQEIDLLTEAADDLAYGITALRDRRERKHAMEAVHEREELVRLLLDSTAEAIYGIDLHDNCILANPACARLLGYADPEQLKGRKMHDLIHHHYPDGRPYPEEACPIVRTIQTRQGTHVNDEVFWHADGTKFDVEYFSYPMWRGTELIGVVVTFLDTSYQKILEGQLRQAQKMEAIGELAGGVAHDFNNLLTIISGYAELLQRSLPEDAVQDRDDVEQIIAGAARAAELTRQLLAFSRRQVLDPIVLDPAQTVAGFVPMLRRLLGENVELATYATGEPGLVRVDPHQLEQVILNLAVNARDAMPDGGQLTIETSSIELDPAHGIDRQGTATGPHVVLEVSDTGVGMDAATLTHIFEPFFTTKPTGQGTGMGLATVYGIVQQSSGSITVYSEPGHGTTFRIYLPRVPDEGATEVERADPPEVAGGEETVLLVEDEPAVRGFARRVLAGLGYTVLEAHDGAEALRIAADHPGAIDLLVTDVVMAGVQGVELAQRLAAGQPGLPTLYVSGFTENAVIRGGLLDPEASYLPKPFSAADLGQAVRARLDRSHNGTDPDPL